MNSNISRRNFVSVTTGAIVVAGGASAQESTAPKKFSAYDQVEIGNTGIKTSRLCFGTGVKSFNRTSNQIKMGRDKFVKLIRDAYEMGIRCFDAADLYGSHDIIAEALSPYKRDSYTLISKIWWRPNGIPEKERPGAKVVVPRFLKECKTDYLDMVHIHCVNKESWLTDQISYMNDLDELKKRGDIRAHGCSAHGFAGLKVCVDSDWIDAVHIRINPFGKSMNGSVEENLAVAKQLKDQRKGLIGMKILGEGALGTDKSQMDQSLAFALKEAQVDVLNIGFMNTAEIKEIAERIEKV
jgi:aryl-alcohol dehydrogenase-like predicted oxidoreductase